MYCSCGGELADRKIVRNKRLVAKFRQCWACGRVIWVHGKAVMLLIDSFHASKKEIKRLIKEGV